MFLHLQECSTCKSQISSMMTSVWEGIENPYSTGSPWSPLSIAYFHSHVLLFWFIGICLQLVLVCTDVDHVLIVLDLHMYFLPNVFSFVWLFWTLILTHDQITLQSLIIVHELLWLLCASIGIFYTSNCRTGSTMIFECPFWTLILL